MLLAVTFQSVVSIIWYVIIAILSLMFMVVVHEFGHYISGKIFHFKILEFAIGFGPPIIKKKMKNGEIFTIRPIPLGGFCQFEDEDAESPSPTAFNNQAPWKRLIVLFSGAFFNLVSAFIIITMFFTFYGQILPTVVRVYPDSANQGLIKEGDAVLRVNGRQMNVLMPEDASKLLGEAGDAATIVVLRNGKRIVLDLTKTDYTLGEFDENGNFSVQLDDQNKPVKNHGFGIATALTPQKLNFFSALGRSFSFTFFLVYKIFAILGQLITGKIGMENAGGPITTIQVMSEAAKGGFAALSYVICLISANLAVMNLLPLPALDGSRMVFCLIEWIFKKPVNKKIEGWIHSVGFILLICFAIFADVFRYLIKK